MDIFERSATTADPQAACLDVDDGAFDAAWYLETYPDVGAAVSQGGLESALAHYLAHGREEGREARFRAPDARSAPIVHLHIPKTAGTALRHALQKSGRRILEAGPDFSYRPETHGDIEVFSGHFGYRSAALVPNGRLITVKIKKFFPKFIWTKIEMLVHRILGSRLPSHLSVRTLVTYRNVVPERTLRLS